MYTIIAWLVVAALIVTLIAVIDVAFKQKKESAKEIERLSAELERQKRISDELCFYAEEIARNTGDKSKVSEQIKEAKNDEEVLAIISGFVHANNDRVHK